MSTSRPRQLDSVAPTPLVLHVVEAYGGGVAAVLTDYVASLPEVEHVVLAYRRPGSQIGNGLHGRAELIDMPVGQAGPAPGRPAHGQATRGPTSSTPTRPTPAATSAPRAAATAPASSTRRTATPSSVADVPGIVRAGYWLMEAALSFRTDAVAAVGEWEQVLARELPRPGHVVLVPHHVQLPPISSRAPKPTADRSSPSGRIRPQKDPAFFAAAARDARLLGGNREWRWVGGGDERPRAAAARQRRHRHRLAAT